MTIKEERTNRAVEYAFEAFRNSFSCSQSSFAGLLREFCSDLGEEEISRLISIDSMTMGLGGRGGTCGVVQGPMHFLGLIYGKDLTNKPHTMDELSAEFADMSIIARYAAKMEKHYGSTDCSEIHPQVMGKCYNLRNLEENARFHNEGADVNCKKVIEYGVRTACDLMLDDEGNYKGLKK